jgi:hypothetical protein
MVSVDCIREGLAAVLPIWIGGRSQPRLYDTLGAENLEIAEVS